MVNCWLDGRLNYLVNIYIDKLSNIINCIIISILLLNFHELG